MDNYADVVKQAEECEKNKDVDKAIHLYLKAINVDPNEPGSIYKLALLYQQCGQFEDAIKQFQKVSELEPDDASVYNNLGVLFYLSGNLDAAVQNMNKTLELDDRNIDAKYALSKIYVEKKEFSKAKAFLNNCLLIDPYFKKASDLLAKIPQTKESEEHSKNNFNYFKAPKRSYSNSLDNPVKVLFAPVEIAYNSAHFIQSLKKYNIIVDNIDLLQGGPRQNDHTTVSSNILDGLKKDPIRTIISLARTYDLIYFQFGCSFLDLEYVGGKPMAFPYPDLNIIKNEGANIASAYWGSDIWDPSMFIDTRLRALGYHDIEKAPYSSLKKQKKIEIMSTFSSFVLTCDNLSHFFPKIVHGDTPVDLEKWPYKKRDFDRKKLKVAHMPSNRYKKNSDIILEVFEKLESEGRIEPVLIENIHHSKVSQILSDCDVLVEQMTFDFGKSAAEAMALGLPVIIRGEQLKEGHRAAAPVIYIKDKFELEEKLIELCLNRELLCDVSLRGREYVEKHHNKEILAGELANYITQAAKGENIDHIITENQIRYDRFKSKYFEQALPVLSELKDYPRLLTTCISGIDNNMSLETCYRYLAPISNKLNFKP